MQSSLRADHTLCLHCGLPADAGTRFCCAGCESVHALLAARGLTHFYSLRDQYAFRKPAAPAASLASSARPDQALPEGGEARLHLEGIHCLGCLWLLERLPEMEEGILSSSLDIAHHILTVRIDEGKISWEKVLELITLLGYTPRTFSDEAQAHRSDQRRQLARIGVAAFCAGNIMLLSVSIYAGADAQWSRLFHLLSAALALPVLSYCAWPLYKAGLLPLRRGQLSVDLAISLALFAGIAASFGSLLFGDGRQAYFDSLTMLVFLLLSSRYLLGQFQAALLKETPFLAFLTRERYERVAPTPGLVGSDKVEASDELILREGQILPADSVLLEPAHFDFSLLTGESLPVKLPAQERVEAGVKLLSPSARVRAVLPPGQSRLARLLDQIRFFQLRRTPLTEFTDRVGRYFVLTVLAISALTLLWLPSHEGLRRVLAFVIVTCPCVLAFAVPLSLARALQVAARRGILFRDHGKLEALAATRTLFLDKTGTVTTGQFELLRWQHVAGDERENVAVAAALETGSAHPVARAILRHLKPQGPFEIPGGHRERPGIGVEGVVDGKLWAIKAAPERAKVGENLVQLTCESEVRALISLGDALRPEAPSALGALASLGFETVLLSGDARTNVAATAAAVPVANWFGELLPEKKAEIVAAAAGSAMVGDGANDAVAFQAAAVSIAMQGAMDLSVRNADITLTKPGLEPLVEAVRLARATMRLIRTNLALSLSYNVVAGSLALAGLMSPLIAAVVMPLSALTVFSFTQWRTREAA